MTGPRRSCAAAPVVAAVEPDERRRDARLNRSRLLVAATSAVHRDGPRVPMATIAAEAGLGIGTLYRHFPTREALLDALTRRSFDQVLRNALRAESLEGTGLVCVSAFLDAGISQRHELVLPLHGGPDVTTSHTADLRSEVHRAVRRMLDRGVADGSIRADISPRDVVIFGAMLAQPLPALPNWDDTCRRLLSIYLNGLASP